MTRPPADPMNGADDTFRLLVEGVEDYAIFSLDERGYVRSWNCGGVRITGYGSSEVMGKHVSMFYLPSDIESGKPQRELAFALRTGRIEVECLRLRKDGTAFRANVVMTAIHDEKGAHRGFANVTRDLTDKRSTVESLRRSEERFRLLIEGISDYAVYMLDPSGVVSTWNSGAQKLKGYAPVEIIGKHYSVFFAPEDVVAGRPATELQIASSTGRFEEEGWRIRHDGTRFWANVVLTALRDDDGTLVGFAKVTGDLTGRKLSEETARELAVERAARAVAVDAEYRITEERERYRALSKRLEVILEGIGDGITVQNARGAIIYANSAAAKACGFGSVKELMSASPLSLLARLDVFDEKGERYDPRDLPGPRVLAGSSIASSTFQVRDRDSRRSWWTLVRASPVLGANGALELAVSIWTDLSADRQREDHERYLGAATAALSSSLDSDTMLASVAELLAPGLADQCFIHLLEGDDLRCAAASPADVKAGALDFPSFERSAPNAISKSMLRAAVDTKSAALRRGQGTASFVVAPIRVRERVLGTMTLIAKSPSPMQGDRDLALVEELARRTGIALENTRLYAAQRKASARLELLAMAGETFAATLDYEQTLRNVVTITLPVLADFAFIDVLEGETLRRIAGAHQDAEVDALLQHDAWIRSSREDKNFSALASGASGLLPAIDDAWLQGIALNAEHLDVLRKIGLRSLITVPIRMQGKILGSLTLCYGKSGRHHADEDLHLVEELARRAGIAVVQARLFAEVRASAVAAEEASRIKDEFLATVSHELRTPLNAIVGWSALLTGKSADPTISRGIDVILRNARAQGKIIEDILDVSRIITGKLRIDLHPADLASIVRDAMEIVRPSAAAKNISVTFAPAKDPSWLAADPERLAQIAWNLLSNAVKFTDEGGKITVDLVERSGNYVLSVGDTGRGIDPDFLPFVFDRFKQADASMTRRVGGLGLGLAIVRHITELHGGHVSAHSEGIGKGSLFSVHLPIRIAEALSATGDTAQDTEGTLGARLTETPIQGLRVLIVDDEADARELLRTLLEHAGATVETASSAAEAFSVLQTFKPAVLVSDIGMPEEDGYSLMRRVRELDASRGGAVPSIALTAYTRGQDKAKALAVGFTTHLSKPVSPEDLVSMVASLAQATPANTRAASGSR